MEGSVSLEKEIRELARSLYSKASEHKPTIFEPQDWMGRMIDWSLRDEALRVALFRFVDVLPSLDSAAEIGRHLHEYFHRVDHALGGLVYLAQALHAGWLVAPVVRRNVVRLARRFIVEEKARPWFLSWKSSGRSPRPSRWMSWERQLSAIEKPTP